MGFVREAAFNNALQPIVNSAAFRRESLVVLEGEMRNGQWRALLLPFSIPQNNRSVELSKTLQAHQHSSHNYPFSRKRSSKL